MATCFYLAIQLLNTEIFPYFRITASCNFLSVILFLLNISVLPYMEDCKMFSYIFMFVINSINMFSWIVFVANIYLHFLSFVSKKIVVLTHVFPLIVYVTINFHFKCIFNVLVIYVVFLSSHKLNTINLFFLELINSNYLILINITASMEYLIYFKYSILRLNSNSKSGI